MPVYCYKCFECDHYEEIKQKFDDEPLSVCPECGKEAFKRVIRNVGVIFKGSGFHITDYSKKSTPAESVKEEPSSSTKESKPKKKSKKKESTDKPAEKE